MPSGRRCPRRSGMKQFYSVSEVGARFEVTSQSVRNWIAAGQLPSVQATPGGRYKVPAPALLAFEQKSGVPPSDPAMASMRLGEPIASELKRVVPVSYTHLTL